MRNPNWHRWDPAPIPDLAVRRTAEQSRCRYVYADGRVCGQGHGADDHLRSVLPDPDTKEADE